MSLLVVQKQVKSQVPNTNMPSKANLRIDSEPYAEFLWRKWGLELGSFKTNASHTTDVETVPSASEGTTAGLLLKERATYDEVIAVSEPLPQSRPVSDIEMKWVSANYAKLRRRFGGQWIAVYGDELIAHGYTLEEVGEVVDMRAVDDPYFEWIPPIGEEPQIIIV
jgi:hypothetical protein